MDDELVAGKCVATLAGEQGFEPQLPDPESDSACSQMFAEGQFSMSLRTFPQSRARGCSPVFALVGVRVGVLRLIGDPTTVSFQLSWWWARWHFRL